MSTAPSHPQKLVIGTRGSELALTQADATEAALAAAFPGIELIRNIIQTTGDRRTDVSLANVAKVEGVFDKGVFIKEIEDALAAGEIDIAVHSLKDLPTVLDERFELAAVLERAAVRDVWLAREPTHSLDAIPAGSRIGTSSVRRARETTYRRPDLNTCDLRGNVPTRLRKVAAGEACDAAILAEAGLVRLGLLPAEPTGDVPEEIPGHPGLFAWRLDPTTFHPAAGQGAIGLEIRAGDEAARAACKAIRHEPSWLRILAEREFLRLLDGGCHTPVGVFSTLENGDLHLKARVFPEGEGAPRHSEARGNDPIAIATTLYQSLA
ncbi:MAG: hydroxymethylbilane synthase [Luteolibacter sp.]